MFDGFLKNKFNRRERNQNKKVLAKKERAKQKIIENRQLHKQRDLSWDNINIENKKLEELYIAGIKGNVLNVLNKLKEKFFKAKVNKDIPIKLAKLLVVGDIVYCKNDNGQITIEKRAKRVNYLSRIRSDSSRFGSEEEQIIASNIDVALIVAPIKNPAFDHKLVDRYLIICQNGGVTPVICLNKVDLTDGSDSIIKHYKELGIDIIETSVVNGIGISELKSHLINKVAVVLGKSGVGKSSLVNSLNPEVILRTQNVNKKSGEGKHTTTSSDLYKWAKNSYIIDTPGIRGLGIDQVSRTDLKNHFPEFLKYKGMCKYDNCTHESEPGCAIKNAIEKKEIKQERYDSYIRILKDLV